MFVVMALVTTCATTPLTHWLYPPAYQRKLEAWKRGEIDWDTGKQLTQTDASSTSSIRDEKLENAKIRKLLVYLSIDNMPSTIAFLSILCPPRLTDTRVHPLKLESHREEQVAQVEEPGKPQRLITAHGIHLVGLTERSSSVMRVSEINEYAQFDPVVNTFQTFGQLYKVNTSGEVDVGPVDSFANTLSLRAVDYASDFILLPWGEMSALRDADLSKSAAGVQDGDYANFINRTLKKAPCNAAVFVNLSRNALKGDPQHPALSRTKSVQSVRSITIRDTPRPHAPSLGVGARHIFTPIFGGPDDLLAIGLTVQMVEKGCTATIVRYVLPSQPGDPDVDASFDVSASKAPLTTSSDPISTTGPSIFSSLPFKSRFIPTHAHKDRDLFTTLRSSLDSSVRDRIVFETADLDDDPKANAAAVCVERAAQEMEGLPKTVGGLVVVGRNGKLRGFEKREGGEVEKCLGVVGMEILKAEFKGGMLVVKAS
jgi:hypothetical protein